MSRTFVTLHSLHYIKSRGKLQASDASVWMTTGRRPLVGITGKEWDLITSTGITAKREQKKFVTIT